MKAKSISEKQIKLCSILALVCRFILEDDEKSEKIINFYLACDIIDEIRSSKNKH